MEDNIRCLGVIPARYESSRLPGKPLRDIAGKPLIQRVWERASMCSAIDRIMIATDDERIIDAAEEFGAECLMTGREHKSGTDRIAEVCRKKGDGYGLIANIQGDMPFINPAIIDSAIKALRESECEMSTAAVPVESKDELLRPSVVKVVISGDQTAMYFSRSPVPYTGEDRGELSDSPVFKHLGLYIYRKEALLEFAKNPPCVLEMQERLEQLRALDLGYKIRVAVIPREDALPSIEVDTERDLAEAVKYAKSSSR